MYFCALPPKPAAANNTKNPPPRQHTHRKYPTTTTTVMRGDRFGFNGMENHNFHFFIIYYDEQKHISLDNTNSHRSYFTPNVFLKNYLLFKG